MAKNTIDYFNKREIENRTRLKKVLIELPVFAIDFFVGIENTTSILTRLNYAYDLRLFFNYISEAIPYFRGKPMKMLSPSCLDNISAMDIERFLSYVSMYDSTAGVHTNGERGKSRKLATIRSFYKYFFNRDMITANTASKVSMPKLHSKEIIKLEVDEIVKLLDCAETGESLVGRQKAFNAKTSKRDLAILTLFLGTGIRISELVGLNIDDINFENNGFTVTRKGGNRTILYFSDEVSSSLKEYIEVRNSIIEEEKEKITDPSALFLSLHNNRISVRAVQNLVKKYSKASSPLKPISPHKLRSTYGTSLYRETQDIYIVADVLGHKDVNTTKKHYASISDDIRRNASNKVQLRDKLDTDD